MAAEAVIMREVNIQEEEDIDVTDPTVCKVSRANAKRAHTNFIKVIKEHIKSRGSRTVLKAHRSHLAELTETVMDWHKKYAVQVQIEDDPQMIFDSYLLPIDESSTEAYQMIEIYLEQRKDDAPASLCSSRRSNGTGRVSHKLEEVPSQRARIQLQLEQTTRNMESEIREDERIAEVEARLVREKKMVSFQQQQRQLSDLLELQELTEIL